MSNSYESASFGGRATEGARRDRSGFQNPDLRGKDSGDPRARALLVSLALAVVIGGGALIRSVDWETLWRGEGYVPWRLTEKHAVGDCRRFGKHLVLYRYDPAHPATDRFESEVLASKEVQALSAGLVWFKRPMTPEELDDAKAELADRSQPAAPRVEVVQWSLDQVLAGPADPRTVTAAAFAELLREALEVNANPSE